MAIVTKRRDPITNEIKSTINREESVASTALHIFLDSGDFLNDSDSAKAFTAIQNELK